MSSSKSRARAKNPLSARVSLPRCSPRAKRVSASSSRRKGGRLPNQETMSKAQSSKLKAQTLNLLWRVSVSTSVEAEDAISALFGELFPEPALAYTDARTGRTVVAVYCPGRARPRPQIVGELRKGIERIRACSL